MSSIGKEGEASLSKETEKSPSLKFGSDSENQGAESAVGEKVEKIRDILFGTQMRDYEKRFTVIEEHLLREVTSLKNETKIRLDSVENYIKKELELLIDRIKTEHNQREESLSELLSEMKHLNKTAEKKINQLDDQLGKSSRDLRQQILDQSKNLSDEILHKYENISTTLGQTAQELRNEKVNRSMLSDLLVETAMRLSDETAKKLGIDSKDIKHE